MAKVSVGRFMAKVIVPEQAWWDFLVWVMAIKTAHDLDVNKKALNFFL